MDQALSDLRIKKAAVCVVLGQPACYMRFGFLNYEGLNLPGVPLEYFMALALNEAVPEGIVRYSNAFNAVAGITGEEA